MSLDTDKEKRNSLPALDVRFCGRYWGFLGNGTRV
jgi:hypothetical protein